MVVSLSGISLDHISKEESQEKIDSNSTWITGRLLWQSGAFLNSIGCMTSAQFHFDHIFLSPLQLLIPNVPSRNVQIPGWHYASP